MLWGGVQCPVVYLRKAQELLLTMVRSCRFLNRVITKVRRIAYKTIPG